MPSRRVAERLPHVHDGQADLAGLLFPDKPVELVQAGLGAIHPTEPDRPMPLEVADHDSVRMPLADRDLVEANDFRSRGAGTLELRAHVLLVELLDGIPVQMQFLGNVLDRRRAAAPAYIVGKALRVERILAQERKPLALHRSTSAAADPAHFQIEVDTKLTARQIAHPPPGAVVKAAMHRPAHAAVGFFERRSRVMIRACGSPKHPCTVALDRKPGETYASASRRGLRVLSIGKSCQISPPSLHAPNPMKIGLAA